MDTFRPLGYLTSLVIGSYCLIFKNMMHTMSHIFSQFDLQKPIFDKYSVTFDINRTHTLFSCFVLQSGTHTHTHTHARTHAHLKSFQYSGDPKSGSVWILNGLKVGQLLKGLDFKRDLNF